MPPSTRLRRQTEQRAEPTRSTTTEQDHTLQEALSYFLSLIAPRATAQHIVESWQEVRRLYEAAAHPAHEHQSFPEWILRNSPHEHMELWLRQRYCEDLGALQMYYSTVQKRLGVPPWHLVLFFNGMNQSVVRELKTVLETRINLSLHDLYDEVKYNRSIRLQGRNECEDKFKKPDFEACLSGNAIDYSRGHDFIHESIEVRMNHRERSAGIRIDQGSDHGSDGGNDHEDSNQSGYEDNSEDSERNTGDEHHTRDLDDLYGTSESNDHDSSDTDHLADRDQVLTDDILAQDSQSERADVLVRASQLVLDRDPPSPIPIGSDTESEITIPISRKRKSQETRADELDACKAQKINGSTGTNTMNMSISGPSEFIEDETQGQDTLREPSSPAHIRLLDRSYLDMEQRLQSARSIINEFSTAQKLEKELETTLNGIMKEFNILKEIPNKSILSDDRQSQEALLKAEQMIHDMRGLCEKFEVEKGKYMEAQRKTATLKASYEEIKVQLREMFSLLPAI